MTLKQRREIVKRFMAGDSIHGIRRIAQEQTPYVYVFIDMIEDVLRDFLNGKFALKNVFTYGGTVTVSGRVKAGKSKKGKR